MIGTRVLHDNSILFQFHHWSADWVGVAGNFSNWQPWAMNRGEGGWWYLQTAPFHEGEYEYKFVVGDQWVNDSLNARMNFDRSNSALHVGGGSGHLLRRTFHSSALGREMPYVIYLPPSYKYRGDRRYPVLYLQGGLMDGCQDWSIKGNLEHVADHLIRSGEIGEMVIVCNEKDDACFQPRDWERYASYLADDLAGHVESEYRVSSHPVHRGIDGLSLGAAWSLRLGSWRPNFYTSIGALSGAGSSEVYHAVINHQQVMRESGTAFQLVVGTDEWDIVEACKSFNDFLDSLGIPCSFILRPGGHDWPLWQEGLELNLRFHSRNFSRV